MEAQIAELLLSVFEEPDLGGCELMTAPVAPFIDCGCGHAGSLPTHESQYSLGLPLPITSPIVSPQI
jgi:hypothetical protein